VIGLDDRQIAGCFNAQQGRRYRVRLIGGASEPLYLPARSSGWATIRYTRDYARSALHELAHWCLAGEARRGRVDYGYWYQPPPRTSEQQQLFARAEVGVQALESLFAEASGLPFRVSVDDFAVEAGAEAAFAAAVTDRAHCLRTSGLPARAEEIRRRLAEHLEIVGSCLPESGWMRR